MRVRHNKATAFFYGVVTLTLLQSAMGQVGGTYDNSHTVVAGGGGSRSTSGSLSVDGTVGQPQAGTISDGGSFSLRGGFWAYQTLVPTAANVTVSGRVVFSTNLQKCRARLSLMQLSSGTVRLAAPNQFGYYKFDDIEIGAYLLSIESTTCQFTPSQSILNLLDNLTDADFSQVPQ